MGKRSKGSRLRNRKTKKRKIDRETEEKEVVGESSNQELVPGEPREPKVFEHEVFLSFSGEDTRTTFTSHLYKNLMGYRIRTFRDSEGLHVGETIGRELQNAINKSKIMMPIFSKGYASSKWCLMELTQMVKFVEMNKETTMICPIFYDVTPSEVRNQTGSFQEAFVGHKKKFDKETVDGWKEALRTVTDLKGWERDKFANGDEAELVAKVGEELAVLLKKMHVELPEHLVGMDQHEAALMQLLDLGCDDVKIVGIVGMGGIGKTTIAKFIYNKLCDKFLWRCSFLENVREKLEQSGGGFNDLKRQLMSDILKRKWDGKEMIPSTFRSTKALIILDDVKNKSQLEEIIGGCDRFGPGSRIIVTTRNRFTLEEEGEKIFEPKVMDSENVFRLFCKHAFRQDSPLEGYENLTEEIVSKVAGLPLSLVVIGSTLATKDTEVWEDTLKKLRITMPEEIQKKLRISYDMLDESQKQIFLDIACHFPCSDKDTSRAASYMWEDCEIIPRLEIKYLIAFSLVKVDKEGRFSMHDQLRDLGREIVRKENPLNPGGRSRLWSDEEALDVLTRKTGTEYVQTLTLGERYEERSYGSLDCLSSEEFKGLSQLIYLDLSTESSLKGNFKGLLSNLRWFRFQPPGIRIPEITNFCLPKLVVLNLSDSPILDDWEEKVIPIKWAANLKVLDLSSCRNLTKTPDLSRFSKLERLNLQGCSDLVEILISPAKGHPQQLKYLNLNSCFELMWSELPEFIWKLKSLEELHMKELGAVTELSEDIWNLANLKILDVKGTEIKKLPKAFGKLEKLEEFNASECRSLEELPETFGDLQNLKRLDISDSGVKRLPIEIGKLEKLEEFNASECRSLEELPETFGDLQNLKRLDISDSGVKRLPIEIGKLEKLEEFNASECRSLEELPETFGDLQNLKRLDISDSGVKRLPIEIGKLEKLEEFNGSECRSLEELPETFGGLQILKRLDISDSGVKRLPSATKRLEKLEELDAGGCKLLGELPESIGNLRSLILLGISEKQFSRTNFSRYLRHCREKEEKEVVGESSNQELVPGEPREPKVFEHEVFLSFRGEDTRTTFTAHLYTHLTDVCRIRTFRDNEGLHVGEKIGPELQNAINKSKIMIPIFSKGYASSKLCLMELTQMVKFVEMNKETTMICPIFYDVTPSEVRNQTGSFQEAFDGHEKKFDKETVDGWKEALRTVTDLKGWERDKIADGDEAELVAKVGEELAVELKKMHVELPERLVGMDQHEERIMQLLDLDCDDVKIVGIVGMGGIGKTTIAMFIYNKLCDQFHQRCSFLENVREKLEQSGGGFNDLKRQLMSDILKRKWDGKEMIPSTFRSTKALIVLDDVKNKSQLEEIIGGCDWFGPGSRIIVTTRNRDTFLEEEREKIFEPKVMNSENALRLFCKHAFRQDSPWEGYEDLTEEIVSKVAGLPLSLVVIGSTLATKDTEVWEDTLKKLRITMPEEIQKKTENQL